jgi:hypothetical protein
MRPEDADSETCFIIFTAGVSLNGLEAARLLVLKISTNCDKCRQATLYGLSKLYKAYFC